MPLTQRGVAMKKQILTAVMSLTLALPLMTVSSQTYALPGKIVFDPSVFARQLEQLKNAKSQLDQAKAQYNQFRGTRDIGALFNQYGKYMPADMQKMYKDYQSGNWDGLADKVATLKKSQKLTGTQKQVLEQMANRANLSALQSNAKINDMFQKSNERFNQIQRMANSIDLQKDPKAAADLLNRIQVESAMLQLQTNQLQMINMMRQSEKELEAQQRVQNAQQFNSSEGKQRSKTKVVF